MIVNYQTTAVNLPAIIGAGTALAANPKRLGWFIQNTGQTIVYVLLGSGTVSSTVFHYVLKAATANEDGTGGSVGHMEGVVYTGIITIASSGTARCVVTELAPG